MLGDATFLPVFWSRMDNSSCPSKQRTLSLKLLLLLGYWKLLSGGSEPWTGTSNNPRVLPSSSWSLFQKQENIAKLLTLSYIYIYIYIYIYKQPYNKDNSTFLLTNNHSTFNAKNAYYRGKKLPSKIFKNTAPIFFFRD